MRNIILVGFLCFSYSISGQELRQTAGLTAMDKGVDAMKDGKYLEADQLFRQSLGMIRKLPSQLAYFFGRNSFHLEKHKQAINWLNKYIELKGTSGQYYDEATRYLAQANAAYLNERKEEVAQTTAQLSNDGWVDCPQGKVLCPVCKGSGVLITPGNFGAVYQTCPFSGLSGILTCAEYNLYLKGELQQKTE